MKIRERAYNSLNDKKLISAVWRHANRGIYDWLPSDVFDKYSKQMLQIVCALGTVSICCNDDDPTQIYGFCLQHAPYRIRFAWRKGAFKGCPAIEEWYEKVTRETT